MNRRKLGWSAGITCMVAAAALAAAYLPTARSQEEQKPTVYTYVSQFQVPRANWAQSEADTEKSFVPLANKMLADGTIIGYVTFESVVHTPDGMTSGASWSSPTISGLLKMLDELRKAGPRPAQLSATKHEDFLVMTNMYDANPSSNATTGYLRVVCQDAKPEHPDEYAAAIKKLLWPAFEEQLRAGAVSYVGLDSEYVVTGPASNRCLVIEYPNAEGLDKWAKAIGAVLAKPSPDRDALLSSVVPNSRRDFLARITHMGHK